MATLKLITIINAPIERCFDLSRSIDLHMLSTKGTQERAVAGKMTGLIEKGETVTWEAIHFGIKQRLTSKITEMKPPYFFSDEMVEGAFKRMYHEHHFEKGENGTIMTDDFYYETPFGILGKLFDRMVLEKYMEDLLTKRNETIRQVAEGSEWQGILNK